MEKVVISRQYGLCVECMEEHQIEYVEVIETNTYRGIPVTSKMYYQYCDKTGGCLEDEFLMRLNNRSLYSAYEEIVNKGKLTIVEKENVRVSVNLNSDIYVRLTEFGKSVLKEQYNLVFKNYPINDKPSFVVDKDGYTRFQIWDFMRTFGEYAYCGMTKMPYEMNVIIEEAKLLDKKENENE